MGWITQRKTARDSAISSSLGFDPDFRIVLSATTDLSKVSFVHLFKTTHYI